MTWYWLEIRNLTKYSSSVLKVLKFSYKYTALLFYINGYPFTSSRSILQVYQWVYLRNYINACMRERW